MQTNDIYFIAFIVPSEAPLNVQATAESPNSISLSWDPPSLNQQNGQLVHYRIIIMETQILHLNDGRVVTTTGLYSNGTYDTLESREKVLGMLHPSYNYTIKIAAATRAGLGVYSMSITVKTQEDGEFAMHLAMEYFSTYICYGFSNVNINASMLAINCNLLRCFIQHIAPNLYVLANSCIYILITFLQFLPMLP